jgi:branched-chain amino acid transport system permease protein
MIVFVVALAMVPLAPPFYLTVCSYIGLYSMVALGLVLLTGVTGLLSFGQAAFMGLGAYTTAMLTLNLHWSPWLTLIISLGLTLVVSLFLGGITLSMGGHYLPLTTMMWGVGLYYLFGSVPALGGYTGLTDIPPLSFFGHEMRSGRGCYYLIWIVCLVSLWVTTNLLNSRQGRAIRALRSGLPMAESFGVSAFRLKIVVFVYSALLACLAGWLYAHMQRFINPAPFGIGPGIEFLFMIVLGGASSVWAALVGASVFTILRSYLQGALPALLGRAGNFEVIVFGILMIASLQGLRGGIWVFIERFLPQKKNPSVPESSNLTARTQPARGELLLKVESVRKEFGGLVAVNDVSCEVFAGEILGLIGPNGAGKTTMFNLIDGELHCTAGNISFASHRISGLSPHKIARYGLIRTFQHVKLIANMTVIENVMLGAYLRTHDGFLAAGARLNGRVEAQVRAEAAKQLRRVGLAENMFALAGSLPLGKQRIVEVARALCADPILLMLDEPAAGLRYLEKQELARLLSSLRGEGLTVLIVEHDMDFLMNLVDRVVVMDFGKKLAEGLPQEIRSNPEVLEAYLGGV